MEGIGNDYVYIDATKEEIRLSTEEIQRLSDRHFGIGSDGVIFIKKSKIADFKMEMYNSDGSYSEMCGNGVRCVGKYIYDNGLFSQKNPKIETGKGVLELILETNVSNKVEMVSVDMGEAILKPDDIPINWKGESVIEQAVNIQGYELKFTAVSMGNPHAVIFLENIDEFPVETIGPLLENHPLFPNRTNVEFVESYEEDRFYQRTWERGAGETLACGTGACAVAVAAFLTGRSSRKVKIDLKGGGLYIEWKESGNIIMRGPAKTVFKGEIEL